VPELPEVESFRKIADRVLVGERIEKVWAAQDRIVITGVAPSTLATKLKGRKVLGTDRRGKHAWLVLDQPPHPIFHFGMTGCFEALEQDASRGRFVKLDLTTRSGRLVYDNPRRLGRIRLVDDPLTEPPISKLGFDPLLEPISSHELADLLSKRRGPIKALLLNQSFVAGVGNWIADDVLYASRIAPRRPAQSLDSEEVKRLRSAMMRVIKKAVSVDADSDRFPKGWLFHVRWGKSLDAETTGGEKVEFDEVGGRTTAWVPSLQR
jgi:formamidopyrimidine-DNA glycosylase